MNSKKNGTRDVGPDRSALETDEELVKRHAASGFSGESEYALFLSLDDSKREVVIARLRTMDLYLRDDDPMPVGDACSALDMEQRNFYRLLKKLKDLGPTRGLSPSFRVKAVAAPAQKGFAPVAERALRWKLQHEPAASPASIIRWIFESCADAGEAPPSASSIQRRIKVLRREGVAEPAAGAAGLQIRVDQTAVDVMVQISGRVELATATFIVDTSSRMILGLGVGDPLIPEDGLMRATRNMDDDLMRHLVQHTQVHFDRVESIDFIAPPGGARQSKQLQKRFRVFNRRVSFDIHAGGKWRHGTQLVRYLGDTLGPYQFKPRFTEEGAPLSNSISEGIEQEIIERALLVEAMRWNESQWQQAEPTVEKSQRMREERANAITALFRDVVMRPEF